MRRRWTATGVAICVLWMVATAAPAAARTTTVPWGETARLSVDARAITDPLSTPEGPGFIALHRARQPASSGEGLLALTMSATGTSWASRRNTSVVAEVSVDGGPGQTIVLFSGAHRFTYEGFLGPLRSGPHRLTIRSSAALSAARDAPPIRISGVQLGVVPHSDPHYLAEAYAPFVYGRSGSNRAYTPLLTYVEERSGGDGSPTLSYTYVISAHDQGDSLVPAYQWGTWGRMTDIVSVISETVASDGRLRSATYSSCSCESLPYPDGVMAPSDTTTKPFAGSWFGHHPMLRDATATNYLSDQGSTPYRFQQAPVAGPPNTAVREAVMDAHPWTYAISNQELPREHAISKSPDNLLVGDYRQYAIVDSDISVSGADSVQFDLRLAGNPTWYSTDYRQMTAQVPSTFAFLDGGHDRSVIKLPPDWGQREITAFRVRLTVTAGAPPARALIHSLSVLELSPGWQVLTRAIPQITIVQAPALMATTLPF